MLLKMFTELAKYESWEDIMDNKSISHIIENAKSFSNIKRDGVGQTTILKARYWQ